MIDYATAVEAGVTFETGVPVSFEYLRNTEPSPYLGSRYQQDIEPAGKYILLRESDSEPPRGWEVGQVSFRKPLVLAFNEEHGNVSYDDRSWKAQLQRAYGKTGKSLSKRLLRDGYDGIVTIGYDSRGRAHTMEIVDLQVVAAKRNPVDDLDQWERAYEAWEATAAQIKADFIAQARARFARDKIVSVESYGNEVRFTSSLHKASRPGVAYQITDFEGDEPIGHHEYDDLDAALAGLWELASPRTKGVPPVPNPAPVDPDIVGALVSGEYHGTPFVGRVYSLDAYGNAEIDVPLGWSHRGRDYSEEIMTTGVLTVLQPRTQGKVAYANERWSWTRGNGKPWPQNRRENPGERPAFKYRYLGTNDEESVCGCCGRQDLKRVAWLVALDEDGNEIGEPVAYGTTCAGQLLRDAYHDRSKKKPSKGQSEKLFEESRNESLREAWERALERPLPPMPEISLGQNKYGVHVVQIGDEDFNRSTVFDREGRLVPAPYPEQDIERAKKDWELERRYEFAVQIAKQMGLHDVSKYQIARVITQGNPREGRLVARIARA